jgi:Fur family ferric uptake transcriptional regulator
MERTTRQRESIRQVFAETDRPLGPQEVLEAAQTYIPGLGIATVYRTLKALTEEGWLIPVELPGESQRYEIAGKGHHHHFRCRACDRVFETSGCVPNLQRLVPSGFQLDRHEVVLYGTCETCVQSSA